MIQCSSVPLVRLSYKIEVDREECGPGLHFKCSEKIEECDRSHERICRQMNACGQNGWTMTVTVFRSPIQALTPGRALPIHLPIEQTQLHLIRPRKQLLCCSFHNHIVSILILVTQQPASHCMADSNPGARPVPVRRNEHRAPTIAPLG